MHRNRILMFFALALGMALALPSTASATVPLGYVQLSGSNLQDSTGTLLANATISFAPVNNAGQPISYQVNGHGQAMFIPVYALVTNGAFTVLIADSSLTNPVNVCYSVSVVNNVSGQSVLGGGYGCVQPSGSGLAVTGGNPWCTAAGSYGGTCNFDLYVPNEAGLVVEQPGTPGATGAAGPIGLVWMGAWSSSTAYVVNNGVSYNGSSYIAVASSTNQTPPNATYWSVLAAQGATGSGSGTVNSGTNYSPSYYVGTGTTVGGITPFNGLSYWSSSAAPTAATSHNESTPTNCIAASGSGTAYTCTTAPTFTPATGDHIQFKADVANTGSATLAVNGAGAATIKKWGGSGALIANDLLAAHWISATFDGTYWQLEGQLGNANSTQINGVTLSGLATGLLKNATGTGVPSIAVAATDYIAPGGAGGTPSSLTLTNATGLPLGTGVTGTLLAAQEPAHTGDATNTAASLAMTVKGLNGTLLSGLASGLLYNTTATGAPSIATNTQLNALIATLTGCSTATYVYTPQGGDCVPAAGGGSGTVASGTIYSPAYYTGTGTTVGGVTPFSGLAYFSTSAAPAAATNTQLNTLIATLTGCSTATYVYTPQGGDCVAPSGGGSGTVSSGTAYSPAYYTGTGTTVGGVTPFSGLAYFSTSVAPAAATAAQIVAAIGSTAVANATNAAGLSATLAAASGGTGEAGTITGVAYHNGSSADTAASAAQIVAAISTTAVANATAAGTSTNTAGGAGGEILYQSAPGATGFSAAGTTGQVATSGGTGAPTFSDLWLPEKIVPANCNNATAGNGMSLPTANAPTAVCRTGTYVQTGYLQFTASDSAQWQDEVPGDWDSANGPYVRVNYTQAAATASQSIIYTIAAVCSATVDDTVWPAVQTFSTTTTGSTINTQYAQTLQLNSTTMANCAAGKMINFQINTASGSSATTNLQMVTVTWPHKTPGVAEAN
jgi:hypothetical protein